MAINKNKTKKSMFLKENNNCCYPEYFLFRLYHSKKSSIIAIYTLLKIAF